MSNLKPFEHTTIKFSSNIRYKTGNIVNLIGKDLNASLDFKAYKTYYNGNFEFGTELLFFETLNKEKLLEIHKILSKNVKGFECYFLSTKNLSGCSNEYLFGNGCEVGLYYKNGDNKNEK